MTKQEWWDDLTPIQKAIVGENREFCKEVWETFGAFSVSRETYEGYTVQDYEPHAMKIGDTEK